MKRPLWTNCTAALLASTALAALQVDAVNAAPAEPSVGGPIEEIFVTSRKREERLQDIPESMTFFSTDQIERANIYNVRGFADQTPNLLIRETFRSNETFLTMRGIASAQGALPPVALIIDGVQMSSNDFLNQDLLDIERIEVLKGPQGALFGQGAIAGAINIVTKQPTNDFEGSVKGSYGNENSYRLSASVGGPIVDDRLFFRLSGLYRDSDGLIKNNRGEDISFSDSALIRGQLLYQNENLKIGLRGSWTDGDGGCCIQDRPPRLPNAPSGNRPYYINIDDVETPGASSNLIGTETTRFRDASLKIDYDFGGAILTSVTGWADVKQDIYGDSDFGSDPIPVGGVLYLDGTAQDVRYYTNMRNTELRLASDSDSPFEWLFGAYYQKKRTKQFVRVGPWLDGEIIPISANQDLYTNGKSWAVFGMLTYHITDQLELSGSLRYDEDKQNNENRLIPGSYAEAKFTKLQPKVQVSYQWTPDFMTYATYSTGFRAGGYQTNFQFDNEETKNYEAGFKSTFADGMVTFNGSFFHIDYVNQFLSYVVFNPTGPALSRTINIPKTRIRGLELELTVRPSDNLTFNAGFGVVDSIIKTVTPDPLLPDSALAVGNKSPLTPKYTFNASATYAAPLSDALDLVFYAAYQRRTSFYFDLANYIQTGTKDFIDGKLSLDADNWSVGLWGKNLSNTRHATNMSITGADLRIPNQPRSYGVEASFKF